MTMRRVALAVVVLAILVAGAASQWWAHEREASLGRTLASLTGPGDLRMIAADACDHCRMARSWLQQHGIAFSECSIDRDPACAAEFAAQRRRSDAVAASGAAGEMSPVPPLFVLRGQPLVGFEPGRWLQRLRGASG
jgi:glutaredoxin